MKILLAEPDESLTALTAYALDRRGHQAITAVTLEEAWRRWMRERPDLVVLEACLPGGDRLSFLRKLREVSTVPVIVLSGKGTDAEVVEAFETGGDDFVMKPFSFRQLIVRIDAIMRRIRVVDAEVERPASPNKYEDLTVDQAAFDARKNGVVLSLTHLELRLLSRLVMGAGRLVSTEDLATVGWSAPGSGEARLLKTHVCHIRRKLVAAGGRALEIVAIPRTGYILRRAQPGIAVGDRSPMGTTSSPNRILSIGDGREQRPPHLQDVVVGASYA